MGKTNMKANVLFTFILLFTLLFSFVFTQVEVKWNSYAKIQSVKSSGNCLFVTTNNQLVQGRCDSYQASWKFVPMIQAKRHGFRSCKSEITYAIVSAYSGKALDVKGKSKDNHAKIQLFDQHNEDNQLWRFYMCPTYNYYIKNKRSGKCIDDRASTQLGGDYIQYDCYNPCRNVHQLFKIETAHWRFM